MRPWNDCFSLCSSSISASSSSAQASISDSSTSSSWTRSSRRASPRRTRPELGLSDGLCTGYRPSQNDLDSNLMVEHKKCYPKTHPPRAGPLRGALHGARASFLGVPNGARIGVKVPGSSDKLREIENHETEGLLEAAAISGRSDALCASKITTGEVMAICPIVRGLLHV